MSILITGAAGFIGSNLAKALVEDNKSVIGIDNLLRGSLSNLNSILDNTNFKFINEDINNYESFKDKVKNIHMHDPLTEVWHLAANSDIPAGIEDANVDLTYTFMTTFNTLKLMKDLKVSVIAFASSSAVYGDHGKNKLFEDMGPLFPISNYGAMKLASEAAISAAVESDIEKAFIYRFPNVIGTPATHGVILDFIKKLKNTPDYLDVLGNGTQQKAYLYVDELIDAMLLIRHKSNEKINYFNIGANDAGVTVRFIAEQVVKAVSPDAKINFGDENRGWIGDVPQFSYSIDKLLSLGWRPKLSSSESIIKAIKQILIKNI